MKSFSILLFIALTLSTLKAQVPIGQWQDYLSFYEVHSVEKVGDKIYAATDASLFSYDTKEYALEKITKLNGLSDVGISTIKSHEASGSLMVGYINGKIDIIKNKSVSSIPDLFLKEMNGSKRINHIFFIGNKALCSTDFGVVVVDIIKKEISETYIIGDDAADLRVNQMTATNDSVFAATAQGVLGAPKSSSLLSFYETWKRVSGDRRDYLSIVSMDNTIIASAANGTSADIVEYNQGRWNNRFTQSNFVTLKSLSNGMAVVSGKAIDFYDRTLNKTDSIKSYATEGQTLSPNFSAFYVDENDTQWIGDASHGLIQISNMGDSQIVPDGPVSNNVFKLKATANALWTVRGLPHQFSPIQVPAECSIYRNGTWIRLDKNDPYLKNAYNLNDIAIDPLNENHAFVSSAYAGIFEIQDDAIIKQYTNANSAIETASGWNLINAVVMDKEGNLYANNQSKSNPVIVKPKIITNNDSANNFGWYKYDYVTIAGERNPWLHQTIQTVWGHFWSISYFTPAGLFVYDIAGTIDIATDDRYRYAGDSKDSRASKLLIWDEDGKEINTTVTYIAEDKSGYIWIGTTTGILVYYRPREIFNIDRPIASRIKIPRNDGSGNADYLLENEEISAIAVDGANRKWIGTTTSGVYLVSDDGTETISAFNMKNSPLLSNNIKSIAINPKSGEVFFATSKGIVSYRGTAIDGEVSYSAVKAFPNPVTTNYQGLITVTGLKENSTVSIIDISGKLVYKAISTGGQIVWNGKNVYNQELASGVYLVFATDSEGSESMVTKIMVVR